MRNKNYKDNEDLQDKDEKEVETKSTTKQRSNSGLSVGSTPVLSRYNGKYLNNMTKEELCELVVKLSNS